MALQRSEPQLSFLLHWGKLGMLKPLTVLFLIFLSRVSYGQTLSEFFQSAQQQTAAIKERVLAVEIAKEQKNQATASVLPSFEFQNSAVFRDPANVGPFGEAFQNSAFFTLTQPLFQGGSEYYAIGAARNLPAIAEYEKRQEELRIFALVAQAFYQSLRFQKEQDVYREQEQTLQDRVKTLQRRAKIGRSKATDVIAAQSQLARVEAERSLVERSLVDSKRILQNLTGVPRVELLIDSTPVQQLTIQPSWDNQVMENPQIKANELLLTNTEKQKKAAQGTYLPNIDANANYFVDRAGILQDSSWDVTLTARWNLFNGGNDSSEVRIQRLQVAQLQSRLNDLRRTLQNDFQSLKKQFFLHQKVIGQMESAVKLARQNYQQHLKEANQGLVSDLEALRVLEEYLQIRRSFELQVFEAKMSHVQLRALAGELR